MNGGTVTNRAGKEVKLTGILTQRASGMGWGKIAQANGFKLGELMRHHGDIRHHRHHAEFKHHRHQRAEFEKVRFERHDRMERAERPERHERMERSERPERPERGRRG